MGADVFSCPLLHRELKETLPWEDYPGGEKIEQGFASEGAREIYQRKDAMRSSVIIACRNIKPEADEAMRETGCQYPVLYLEPGLHDRPELLKIALQQELDRVSNVKQVILAMGCCGNAILGLKAHEFRVVVPRVDDCITLLLGSQQKRQAIMDEAITYFFTKGWLDAERNILDDHKENIRKYGRKKADTVLEIMFRHYQRMGLVDTGAFDLEPQIDKIEKISRGLKLRYEVFTGTMSLLKKLLAGPYDDDFIVIEPGGTISLEDIFGRELGAGSFR